NIYVINRSLSISFENMVGRGQAPALKNKNDSLKVYLKDFFGGYDIMAINKESTEVNPLFWVRVFIRD
ncbi:MAG: hypothetical protein IJZ16_07525, partial [Clostridia bacterium]|nr:hypothetical protein [Clostridia bacterium]